MAYLMLCVNEISLTLTLRSMFDRLMQLRLLSYDGDHMI